MNENNETAKASPEAGTLLSVDQRAHRLTALLALLNGVTIPETPMGGAPVAALIVGVNHIMSAVGGLKGEPKQRGGRATNTFAEWVIPREGIAARVARESDGSPLVELFGVGAVWRSRWPAFDWRCGRTETSCVLRLVNCQTHAGEAEGVSIALREVRRRVGLLLEAYYVVPRENIIQTEFGGQP